MLYGYLLICTENNNPNGAEVTLSRVVRCKKNVGDNMSTIETSKEDYKRIGINLSDEQYQNLFYLNMLANGNDNKDIPIHFILMTLKALGLIPTEQMGEISDSESTQNSEDICKDELQQAVGIFKK